MKRISARAIIVMNDKKVVLMHRIRNGYEYWVAPGGRIEEGESSEEAVKREVMEEVGITIKVGEEILETTMHIEDMEKTQKFFLCTYLEGVIGTGKGEEMLQSNQSNSFEVELIGREEIERLNIVPAELKEFLSKKI